MLNQVVEKSLERVIPRCSASKWFSAEQNLSVATSTVSSLADANKRERGGALGLTRGPAMFFLSKAVLVAGHSARRDFALNP